MGPVLNSGFLSMKRLGVEKKKAKPAVPCTLYTVPTPIVQAIFPQIPAETAANMVLCRDNIFSKEMYASMRAKPMRR